VSERQSRDICEREKPEREGEAFEVASGGGGVRVAERERRR